MADLGRYMKMMRSVIAVLCFLLLSIITKGQGDLQNFEVQFRGTSQNFNVENIIYKQEVLDIEEIKAQKRSIVLQLIEKGHLTASVDSSFDKGKTHVVVVFVGEIYSIDSLKTDHIPDEWLSSKRNELLSEPVFNPTEISDVVLEILKSAENNGYPFAEIKINLEEIADEKIKATIELNKGSLYVYDSIEIIGNANISTQYLRNYLNLKRQGVYKEKDVQGIDKKLRSIPFVELTAPTRVFFGYKKMRIQVHLDKKKSDRFDGIIGFAPNSESSDGKLLLTGEMDIALLNLFNRGVGFRTHWRSFLQNSQELEIDFAYPFLLNTNLGLDLSFDLMKLDTTFLKLKTGIGGRILLSGSDYFRFYYSNQNSTILSPDTLGLRQSKTLPTNNPVKIRSYGLGVNIDRRDYRFNPRKGFRLLVDGSLGTRNIERNATIERVQFQLENGSMGSVYDLIDLTSLQGQFDYLLEGYMPIFEKSTIKIQVSGQQIVADNILRNDLFRIGGARSLRGFDEQSIEGHNIHQLTLEYRYLLNRDANFHLFGNLAYIENASPLQGGFTSDLPYGFGAGVNIQLPNGILNLDYALGAQNDLPIQFNRAKVHFGLINYL